MSACLASAMFYFLLPNPAGCPTDAETAAQKVQETAYEQWRDSLDFRFLDAPYASCKVEESASTSLTQAERCLVSKLSARCSESDDCLVQCIASGMNSKVGGGCQHICFATKFDFSEWSEPKGMSTCAKLGGGKGK